MQDKSLERFNLQNDYKTEVEQNTENNKLLATFLKNTYIKDNIIDQLDFIFNACSNNCARCSTLYYEAPKVDNKVLLKNLKICLDYAQTNNLQINNINLVCSDFFEWPEYEAFIQLLNNYTNIKSITASTLGLFLDDPSKLAQVNKWLETANVTLEINYCLENYKLDFSKITAPNKCFNFLIDPQQKIYWTELFNTYCNNLIPEKLADERLLLGYFPKFIINESADWNSENLEAYSDFVEWIALYVFSVFLNFDLVLFKNLFVAWTKNITTKAPGCSMYNGIKIRLADLAIVPCSGIQHTNFIYCWLEEYAGQIIGVKSNNWQMALSLQNLLNTTNFTICASCALAKYCPKSCMVANYIESGEFMLGSTKSCKINKAFFKAIQAIAKEYNVLCIAREDNTNNIKDLCAFIQILKQTKKA